MEIRKMTPLFAAELSGVDIANGGNGKLKAELRREAS